MAVERAAEADSAFLILAAVSWKLCICNVCRHCIMLHVGKEKWGWREGVYVGSRKGVEHTSVCECAGCRDPVLT